MVVAVVKNIISNRLGSTQIFIANNKEQALTLLEKEAIDVVLADWQIPQIDGQGLLQAMSLHVDWKDIPFVVMSSTGDKEFVVKAIQSGASHFVVKPFSPEKLEDAVRKAWNSAQKRNARRYAGLPAHTLVLQLNGCSFDAQMVDISRTGALITLNYDEQIKLFGHYDMALEFDEIDDVGIINIAPLPARVIRLEADSGYHHSAGKCQIALAFSAELLGQETKKNLTDLFTFLKAKEKAQLKQAKS
jgi:CheY-like chemotaxis protein